MTQCIIPGCEENPDPKDVIIIDHTKPMKEINMNETKDNVDNIPESFKQFLASGSSVIETCRELLAENERLRKENGAWFGIKEALLRYGIMPGQVGAASELDGKLTLLDTLEDTMEHHAIENVDALNAALESLEVGKTEEERTKRTEEVLTLRDFKSEMDAIHEEFNIEKDVQKLREALDDWKSMKEACDNHLIEYADLDSTLEEKDQLDNVLSDHDITDASELEDTLTDMEDAKAYEKGFNELAEFVEKIKEVIGHCVDDIPATDMEDYK